MTYADPVARRQARYPTDILTRLAAIIATLAAAGIIAVAAIQLLGAPSPTLNPSRVDPAVLAAEARWELQHRLVSNDLDPQRQAERTWESRSRQISLLLD